MWLTSLDELQIPAYWSLVEINVGITCVCLPAIRPFLRACKHAVLGKSRVVEDYYYASSVRQRQKQEKSVTTISQDPKDVVTERSDSTVELFEIPRG